MMMSTTSALSHYDWTVGGRGVQAWVRHRACPARAVAIIMPTVNTEVMNEHLKEISTQVVPCAHAALLCDGAGLGIPRIIEPSPAPDVHR